MVTEPKIEDRKEMYTVGIRTQIPVQEMGSGIIPQLHSEVMRWLKGQGMSSSGAPFLRYHVIDMAGEMDIEVGIPVAAPMKGDDRIKAGVLPAGRYASLIYSGNGYSGNKALVEWAKANGIAWDRWDDPKGDSFRCRYEAYLTDPKIEPRKTRWDVEVAIKLAD